MNTMQSSGRTWAVRLYTIGLTEPFLFSLLMLFGIPNSIFYRENLYFLYLLFMTGVVMYLWVHRPAQKRPVPAALWVLVAGFAWIVLRFVLDPELFMRCGTGGIWERAYEAWFLFFPCAFLLTREELGRCIRVLTMVWGVGMGIVAALGIYCTATNSRYYTPVGTVIGIGEYDGAYRLWLTNYPTISAENLLVAAIFATLALFMSRHRWQKVCFGLLLVPLYVALGLTDGRSAMVAFGLLIAAAVFVRVLMLPGKRAVLRYGAGIAAALLTVVVLYGVCGHISGYFHVDASVVHGGRQTAAQTQPEDRILLAAVNDAAVSDGPAPSFLTAAPAQEEIVIHRKFDSTLSGRTFLWSCALKALANNDGNMLLVGRTPGDYGEFLFAYGFPDFQPHVHNIYLQVAVEWGLPGLAVMVAFLVLLAIASFRLMLRDGLPFWERFLPAPALALLAVEFVDCFLRLSDIHVALQAAFLFMGMTIGVEQKNR